VESEFLVESFIINLVSFIKIDNIPSLVGSTVFTIDDNGLTFSISSACDIKSFSVGHIDEVFSLILEDLPPVGVGAPDLHVSGSS
jgi:hypothetical protein